MTQANGKTGHTYRLRFFDPGRDLHREVEFNASSDYRALVQTREIAKTRTAQLFRDGKLICSLRNLDRDGWAILPASEPGIV